METVGNKLQNTAEIYKYLNFDQMPDYSASLAKSKKIIPIAEVI
jgi:aconitate hydratase 2/2-methylisocitrate dehydratase